jgi:hypothetical protein
MPWIKGVPIMKTARDLMLKECHRMRKLSFERCGCADTCTRASHYRRSQNGRWLASRTALHHKGGNDCGLADDAYRRVPRPACGHD